MGFLHYLLALLLQFQVCSLFPYLDLMITLMIMFTAKSSWAVIWRSNHYYEIKKLLTSAIIFCWFGICVSRQPSSACGTPMGHLTTNFITLAFPSSLSGSPSGTSILQLHYGHVNLSYRWLIYLWEIVFLFTLKLEYLLYISAIPSHPHCSSVTVSLQEPSKLHWSSHLWCVWPLPASLHGPVALAAWLILTWHTISKRMLARPANIGIVLNDIGSN